MTAQIAKREIGNLLLENIPDIPETISERLNQYHSTREAFVVDWLYDNKGLLISTRFGEAAQLHLVESAGGTRRQLTFFNEPVFSAAMRPRCNGFLFSKDLGFSREQFENQMADTNASWVGPTEEISLAGTQIRGQNSWWWLIAAVLVVLFVELALLAGISPKLERAGSPT